MEGILEINEYGWGEYRLEKDNFDFVLSYLCDPFFELTCGVFPLLEGAVESEWTWQSEPGELSFHLRKKQAGKFDLTVIKYNQLQNKTARYGGRNVLEGETSVPALARWTLKQMENFRITRGDSFYLEHWGYIFPSEDLIRLREYVKSLRKQV